MALLESKNKLAASESISDVLRDFKGSYANKQKRTSGNVSFIALCAACSKSQTIELGFKLGSISFNNSNIFKYGVRCLLDKRA